MLSDSATVVLLAIQTASRLSDQVRQAFVDSTRRRELTLPLPRFFSGTNGADAVAFFSAPTLGGRFLQADEAESFGLSPDPRLKALVQKANSGPLEEAEERELIDFHITYRNVLSARDQPADTGPLTPGAMFALLSVQQWQKSADPTPSTLRRVAGTLIEVGVQYARLRPDLFDPSAAKGRVALGFLTALDELDVSATTLADMPRRLFAAALDTAQEHPEFLSGDPKIQELIQVTTRGIATSLAQREAELTTQPDAIARAESRHVLHTWTELVFRSTLATGGALVLSDPARFLGAKSESKAAVLSVVGNSVLQLVLQPQTETASVLSRSGLEALIATALEACAEHPEILAHSNNQALTALLGGLARDLSTAMGDRPRIDLLPEVARMTLQRTGQNLALFWPDLARHPERNALTLAAQTLLRVLTHPAEPGQPWQVRLRREDLLQLTEYVLDELVRNPGWLLKANGELTPVLGEVATAVLFCLRQHGDPRLSAGTGTRLLHLCLAAVALRPEFARPLADQRPLIAGVMEILLRTSFDPTLGSAVAWRLAGAEALAGLVETTLRTLSHHPLEATVLPQLETALRQELTLLVGGHGFDVVRFGSALATALRP